MFAVIFKAEIAQLDDEYSLIAARMRELAINQYGCVEFSACCEDNQEIAISYWPSQDHITRWKQDPEHLAAQEKGREKWYHSYQVQVVEVLREYSH